MNQRAHELIQLLDLSEHPEGGYYKEVYRSTDKVISPVNKEERHAVTDIYFLLLKGQVSRFHRVCHDEIWNFYEGDPLTLIEIQSDSLETSKIILGECQATPHYKHCIKASHWQAAYSVGEYSLVGCTVAPGFDFKDFQFLKDSEDEYSMLCTKYPDFAFLM